MDVVQTQMFLYTSNRIDIIINFCVWKKNSGSFECLNSFVEEKLIMWDIFICFKKADIIQWWHIEVCWSIILYVWGYVKCI